MHFTKEVIVPYAGQNDSNYKIVNAILFLQIIFGGMWMDLLGDELNSVIK